MNETWYRNNTQENYRRPITTRVHGKIILLCQISLFDYTDKPTKNHITIDDGDKDLVKNNKWYYKNSSVINKDRVPIQEFVLGVNINNIKLIEEE
ncbi:25106_t:CDS:1, partial [Gigaspora margarita]